MDFQISAFISSFSVKIDEKKKLVILEKEYEAS